MGIIGWLILSFGALVAVHGSKCIPETAVCSHYWVRMEPHKNLLESEDELNSWCRKQSLFFSCLEDVLLGIYGNYSKFPTNVLVSKMFTEDLCLEGSTSRKRYLDNAACINQLDVEYCTLPEYLEIVTPDGSVPPTKCSIAEKTFNCIAAAMVMRCGFDAGRVYRYLLKVTKYGEEVCGVGNSEGATCEELPYSEIYYGLIHRFGSVPEQGTEAASLDEQPSIYQTSESLISEAINVLDDSDSSESDSSSASFTSGSTEVNRNTDEFRKRPIILEPFKGLLFYNYSDEVFEFYWRQPNSFPISRVTCDHNLIDSDNMGVIMECNVHHGYEEPECALLAEDEILTPELIRDIDLTIPQESTMNISPTPDWTGDLRDYKRHRMSWGFFFNVKLVNEDKEIWQANKELEVEEPNANVCTKELRFYDLINDDYLDWWQCPNLFSDELRKEVLDFFFQERNRDIDFFHMSTSNINDTDGKFRTLINVYEPLFHGFEKFVCQRVNECHPRGRGVFKCSFERRGIEGCDTCCVQFPYYAKMCKQPPEIERFHEDNSSEERSTLLEDESLGEQSTSVVKDSTTFSPGESTNFVTQIDESGDLVVDTSAMTVESDHYFSSDANLVFLRRNSDDGSDDSIVVQSEDSYSISEEDILYDNLSEPELKMLNNNVFTLKTVPSIADVEAAYEIEELED